MVRSVSLNDQRSLVFGPSRSTEPSVSSMLSHSPGPVARRGSKYVDFTVQPATNENAMPATTAAIFTKRLLRRRGARFCCSSAATLRGEKGMTFSPGSKSGDVLLFSFALRP
jgi:hypothetical protein